MAGTYRLYEFDVTREAKPGETNVLAVEVFPPEPDDLAWTWVDWNPTPPDKNMGLWRPVYLTTSGDVVVRYPHVVTQLDAGLERANLTVTAELRNLAGQAVRASRRRAHRADVAFRQDVDLAAGETKTRRPSRPTGFPQLRLAQPAAVVAGRTGHAEPVPAGPWRRRWPARCPTARR